MPNSCSAPRCKTGYYNDHSGIPVFQIPSNSPDIEKQWRLFLHRDDADQLKKVYLCAKHFDPQDIINTQTYLDVNGMSKTRSVQARLKKGALPKYLPKCPTYLNDNSIKPQRLDRNRRESELQIQALNLSSTCFEAEQRKFAVGSFDELITRLPELEIPSGWIIWKPVSTTLNFVNLTSTHPIILQNYLTIDHTLQVTCCHHGNPVDFRIPIINDIRQINTLIDFLTNYCVDRVIIGKYSFSNFGGICILELIVYLLEVQKSISSIKQAITLLENALHEPGTQNFSDLLTQLHFILDQLENSIVTKPRRRYNMITMILSLKSHLSSHACYKQLRNMDCISLPHESSLQRLYSRFDLDTTFLPFLKAETSAFNEFERHLCLNMDEIHVKSNITYKGGKIYGIAECSKYLGEIEPAKTILCFMVSSLYKKWCSAVRLLPLVNPKASDLLPITIQVIKDIEQLGLFVDVIVSDNYPLNANLFKLLGNSKEILPCVPHPNDNQRSLYLMFDFVHIKTIRNNWLNQKDFNCTYLFPHFEDILHSNYPMRLSQASFQDLRLQYKSEQLSVAKLAPRLTYKACWPSILERQNVTLALRIFDHSNVAALNIQHLSMDQVSRSQTSSFIEIISRVWKIFNVNTPWKGISLNDPDSLPLKLNDSRFQFLSSIVRWLDQWRALGFHQGKLTPQTFTSFRHSCITLPKVVEYLTKDIGFSYVLSSFVQNDPIEHHFGLYRQMSGSNYNLSVCQVLENERTLKLSNILKLFNRQTTVRKDRESFMEFINTLTSEQDNISDCGEAVDLQIYSSLITKECADPNLETQQALAFISGYAAFSVMKKFIKTFELCNECVLFLTQDKCLELEEIPPTFQLIQFSDRGGLKWPSKTILGVVFTLWKLVIEIEQSPILLKHFLTSNSRTILVQLALLKLESDENDDVAYECFQCNATGREMLHGVLMTASNCFLNNKAKNINFSATHSGESKRKILKLSSK